MSDGIGRLVPPLVKALFSETDTPASDVIGIACETGPGTPTVKAFFADAGSEVGFGGRAGAGGVIAAAFHELAPGASFGPLLPCETVEGGESGEPGTGLRMPVTRVHRLGSLLFASLVAAGIGVEGRT